MMRSQFALAKSGKHQRLVDQGPFLPEPFQPAAGIFRRSLAYASPFRLPRRTVIASNSGRRRATSKSRVNSASVSARRCPAAVGLASAFGTPAKGLLNSRPVANAPVAERHPGLAILVAGAGPHAFGLAVSTSQRSKAVARPGRPAGRKPQSAATRSQPAYRYRCIRTGNALRLLVVKIGGDMIGKRRALVVDYRIFGGGENFAFDQFGPAFQLAEYRPGGRFIPAAGRHFPDDPRAVPILGGVGPGVITIRSIRSLPAVTVPFGVLPLASFHSASRCPLRTMIFAPAGSGLVKVFLKTVPMISPFVRPASTGHFAFRFADSHCSAVSCQPTTQVGTVLKQSGLLSSCFGIPVANSATRVRLGSFAARHGLVFEIRMSRVGSRHTVGSIQV